MIEETTAAVNAAPSSCASIAMLTTSYFCLADSDTSGSCGEADTTNGFTYRTEGCEAQADGRCGWTQSDELRRCLEKAGGT